MDAWEWTLFCEIEFSNIICITTTLKVEGEIFLDTFMVMFVWNRAGATCKLLLKLKSNYFEMCIRTYAIIFQSHFDFQKLRIIFSLRMSILDTNKDLVQCELSVDWRRMYLILRTLRICISFKSIYFNMRIYWCQTIIIQLRLSSFFICFLIHSTEYKQYVCTY